MNWRLGPPDRRLLVLALMGKDVGAIRSNVQVWLPMLIVPVVLGVVLPAIFVGLLVYGDGAAAQLQQLTDVLERVPESVRLRLAGGYDDPRQQAAHYFLNYFVVPLFLLVPLMVSSVISADSFAGEKERGTLEGLLFSPVSVQALFTGKALAAFVPALGMTLLTLVLMAGVANGIGWPLMGGLFFPNAMWLPLTLLVIPALSLFAILLNVYISARVATFQAAYQLGGLIVLPVLGLLFSQVTGVLFLSMPVVFALGAFVLLVDAGLLLLLRRYVNRSQLFESQV